MERCGVGFVSEKGDPGKGDPEEFFPCEQGKHDKFCILVKKVYNECWEYECLDQIETVPDVAFILYCAPRDINVTGAIVGKDLIRKEVQFKVDVVYLDSAGQAHTLTKDFHFSKIKQLTGAKPEMQLHLYPFIECRGSIISPTQIHILAEVWIVAKLTHEIQLIVQGWEVAAPHTTCGPTVPPTPTPSCTVPPPTATPPWPPWPPQIKQDINSDDENNDSKCCG